jgi:hypothetical protein
VLTGQNLSNNHTISIVDWSKAFLTFSPLARILSNFTIISVDWPEFCLTSSLSAMGASATAASRAIKLFEYIP